MNLSNQQIQLQLINLVQNILATEQPLTIDLHTKLKQDLNFDSLSTISLFIAVEQTFAIKIVGVSPETLITLCDWCDMIIRQIEVCGNINSFDNAGKSPTDDCLRAHSQPNEVLPDELAKIYTQSIGLKKLIRFLFQNTFYLLSLISKPLVKLLIKKLYSTPGSMTANDWEIEVLKGSKKDTVEIDGFKVHYYSWGAGPSVILCHGWSGHASQLGMFVAPLVNAGYKVVAIDGPGHGLSDKKSVNWQSYSYAIRAVVERQQRVTAMVGHCMGGVCIVRALQLISKSVDKVVLINSFDNFSWLADLYSKTLGIDNGLVNSVFEASDRAYSSTRQDFFSCRSALADIDCACLIVHDNDDDFVPFRHSEYISNIKNAKLYPTNGLGHRLILVHVPTITAITQFIVESK